VKKGKRPKREMIKSKGKKHCGEKKESGNHSKRGVGGTEKFSHDEGSPKHEVSPRTVRG